LCGKNKKEIHLFSARTQQLVIGRVADSGLKTPTKYKGFLFGNKLIIRAPKKNPRPQIFYLTKFQWSALV